MAGIAVITEACIDVKDRACVDVCPVQCIYEFDPATNVLFSEEQAGSGKVLWRSSNMTVCTVDRQACTRPGTTTVLARAEEVAKGAAPVVTGCESVSWASGPTPRDGVVYAAVMYGERALPGMEMARRLDSAFKDSGL